MQYRMIKGTASSAQGKALWAADILSPMVATVAVTLVQLIQAFVPVAVAPLEVNQQLCQSNPSW